MQQLLALLLSGAVRILTLTGPGGVGKTRLALKVGAEMQSRSASEVVFLPLAPTTNPELLAPEIGLAFGLSNCDTETLPERMPIALSSGPVLLILDNFEQLLPAAAALVARLTLACPTLSILVTSRVLLRLSIEHEYPIPPLELPTIGAESHHFAVSPATRLFIERAHLGSRDLTPDEWTAVAGICRRVDGLPLAIELAAAKTRLLPVSELLKRMDRALPLLLDGPRDAPERLQTMRNAIAWSSDLLSDHEQQFFAALSVFSGGFTIASAEAIAAPEAELDTLEMLQVLLDHSLIRRVDTGGGPPRYIMLETIREFGQELLLASGLDGDVRDRHAAWYAEFFQAQRVEDVLGLTTSPFQFPGEEDNLRDALDWSIAGANGPAAAKLVLSLMPFWWRQGFFSEARGAVSRVLAMPELLPTLQRGVLTGIAAEFAFQQSAFELSRTLAEDALNIARNLRDIDRIRWHLRQVSWAKMVFDPPSAIEPIEEVVELSEQIGDGAGVVRALHMLAMAKVYDDRLHEAIAHATDAQSIIDSLDDIDGSLQCESNQVRGSMALYSGAHDVAEPLLIEALSGRRAFGNRVYEMHCLRDLGRIALERGDRPLAASRFADALELAYLMGSEHGMSFCYSEIAAVSIDPEASALLLGAEFSTRFRLKFSSLKIERTLREHTTRRIRDQIGDARFEAAFESGRTKSSMELYGIARQALSTVLNQTAEAGGPLTAREREVLVLITEGKSDREIGDALFVSRRTAATHVRNLFAKLDVHSRAEAAAWAVRHDVA